ncbi:MAG: methionyl-tRNA formyltransferase, partial [Pirellulaceae bacterium]
PGSYTHWQRPDQQSLRLIIVKTSLCDQITEQGLVSAAEGTPAGQIVACEPRRLVVATGNGLLCLEQLQPAGRRAMSIDAFLRGYSLAVGDQLGE